VRFEIIMSPRASTDLKRLSAHARAEVREHLERHLRHEPTHVSRSRIKRLRSLRRPQYRLLIGEIRAYYDVIESQVHVLTIISKEQANAWLHEFGVPE
jgi:mRNA interferase RelE/StbE